MADYPTWQQALIAMAGEYDYSQPIFTGCAEFPAGTGADAVMRTIDVPDLGLSTRNAVVVGVRNGSEDEDITVSLGNMSVFSPYTRGDQVSIACTPAADTDNWTTATAHNFSYGDRVIFTGAGGGVTANVYYYVIPAATDSSTVFSVSATPGGTVFNVANATANVVDYAPSPLSTDSIACAGAVDTDIYTSTAAHGLTKGDCLMTATTVDCLTLLTPYYVIATATGTTFQLSAARGGSTVNVGATTAQTLYLPEEYAEHTSFTVPKFAASSYTANVAGIETRLVSGWPQSGGGRICVSPTDQTYDAFCATVTIWRA